MLKHWLYILIFISTFGIANGQDISNLSQIEKDFASAWDLMLSFKNDSAIIILENLMISLNEQGKLDSSLGLQIQLRHAEALEKDHQDEIAIKKLIHLAEISHSKKQGDVLTNAHLSLARLFEKIGREETCYEHLQSAEKALENYDVDSLYTRYCIRKSSYHRVFSDQDSAMFFANEIIRTAPLYNLKEEYAVGNLLLGMLYAHKNNDKAIKHYKAAGSIWYELEDYNGYGAIMENITGILLRENKLKEALIYNDSSLHAAEKAITLGNDSKWMLHYGYRDRAKIYNQLGQHDSAWHYLNKGYQMELDDAYQQNHDKIIEIDAKYKDGKKAEIISVQKKEIQQSKKDRRRLYLIISIFLLLGILSAYFYYQLKKANTITQEQSNLLQETNVKLSNSLEQQIVLQGEVHHRVKNNLQVIISLLELQMDEVDEPIIKASFTAMANRIYSIAAIHEILYQKEGAVRINISDYVENLCLHFSNFSNPEDKPSFNLELNSYELNLVTSMPVGIIITELLTNSLKYARIRGQILQIEISLVQIRENYCLTFKDNGYGYPNGILKDKEGALGAYLINSMVRQLGGEASFSNKSGATFSLNFQEKNN
ncbi:MAG: two-component sensor histidine kinase [Maribacter sp.]|jgi:two-component sensor histidine kinase